MTTVHPAFSGELAHQHAAALADAAGRRRLLASAPRRRRARPVLCALPVRAIRAQPACMPT